MKKLFGQSVLATAFCGMLALTGVASADLYDLRVTTSYQFGAPVGSQGYVGGPDTGFVTITNVGPTTFNGTIGDVAVTAFSVDYSQSFAGVTLGAGQSFTFGTSPESSNVGGFNSPYDGVTPQLGIQILLNGTAGSNALALSVYDSQIHSGVVNGGGLTDAYVLQGGNPFGSDYGDGIEVTQAPGVYDFRGGSSPVPEPSTFALLGLGGIGLAIGAYRRRRMAAI